MFKIYFSTPKNVNIFEIENVHPVHGAPVLLFKVRERGLYELLLGATATALQCKNVFLYDGPSFVCVQGCSGFAQVN